MYSLSSMPIELLLTNIGFGISFVVCMAIAILVYVRRPKNGAALNIVFFFTNISVCVWVLSYVLGINLLDPQLSRLAFMFNLVTLFTITSNVHMILLITGRYEPRKLAMKILYGISGAFVVFYSFFPDSFLLPSEPKLYLPNYFNPGSLYSLQDFFFFCVLLYLLYQLYTAYHHANYKIRNRLKYFITGILFAYGTGLVLEFLLYGINVDPIIACLIGFYTVPLAYAIIRYDVIDLGPFAKRAFGYALSITAVTLFISLIGYANDWVTGFFPGVPEWALPFLSATIAVGFGVFAWKKIKEVDVLKYQFVFVVTHKFRAPLTQINWSVDSLRTPSITPEEHTRALDTIADANLRLVKLTDMLAGLSGGDTSQTLYSYSAEDMEDVINETREAVANKVLEKHISLEINIPPALPKVYIDRKRMQFAIQMVIENAITYSPDNGKVMVRGEQKKDFLILSVKDFGMGISKVDIRRLFSKFFRSSAASRAHTEGLGIGLFLSKDIMEQHGGDLTVESDGPGTGSTFFLKIPFDKSAR